MPRLTQRGRGHILTSLLTCQGDAMTSASVESGQTHEHRPTDPAFRLGFANGEEEPGGVELAWSGAPLPEWMQGAVLVRNGPGLFHLEDERMKHWFDGLALLTRFEFGHGSVRYRSAFL